MLLDASPQFPGFHGSHYIAVSTRGMIFPLHQRPRVTLIVLSDSPQDLRSLGASPHILLTRLALKERLAISRFSTQTPESRRRPWLTRPTLSLFPGLSDDYRQPHTPKGTIILKTSKNLKGGVTRPGESYITYQGDQTFRPLMGVLDSISIF